MGTDRRQMLVRIIIMLGSLTCTVVPMPRGRMLPLGQEWGLGGAWDSKEVDTDKVMEHILSQTNLPSVRLLMKDTLFIHHLSLFLDQPSKQNLNKLTRRAKTLRRRKNDEISNRFFLETEVILKREEFRLEK